MNMKKWLAGLVVVGTGLVLGACGNGGSESTDASGEDVINVATLTNIEHASMTAAEEGFYEALADGGYVEGENIVIESLSAQGSQSNLNPMAEQAASDNDLVLSLGTGTTQAIANTGSDTDVVFTAVTDPVGAGVVESMEEPGGNITGTSDAMPIADQIDLLLSLDPQAQSVGVIYNSSEPNSTLQAEEAIQIIEDRGLEPVVTTVTSTNDVQQNLTSIAGDIDLLYAPTDNTIAGTTATVRDITTEYQIPSVLGSPEMVEEGGLATYSIDYHSLGYQAGEMAVQILNGEAEPATMPVETADEYVLVVNEEVAADLGIDPESIQAPQ